MRADTSQDPVTERERTEKKEKEKAQLRLFRDDKFEDRERY